MEKALIFLAFLILLLVFMLFVGLMFREHIIKRSMKLHQDRDTLWRLLSDFAGESRWRSDLASKELIDAKANIWKEVRKDGIETKVKMEIHPSAAVITQHFIEHPYLAGNRSYQIEESGNQTRLTITEQALVKNILFRSFYILFGPKAKKIDRRLKDIAKHFNEKAVIS